MTTPNSKIINFYLFGLTLIFSLITTNAYAEVKGLEILLKIFIGIFIIIGLLPAIFAIIILYRNKHNLQQALIYVSMIWLFSFLSSFYIKTFTSGGFETILFFAVPTTIVEIVAIILFLKNYFKTKEIK